MTALLMSRHGSKVVSAADGPSASVVHPATAAQAVVQLEDKSSHVAAHFALAPSAGHNSPAAADSASRPMDLFRYPATSVPPTSADLIRQILRRSARVVVSPVAVLTSVHQSAGQGTGGRLPWQLVELAGSTSSALVNSTPASGLRDRVRRRSASGRIHCSVTSRYARDKTRLHNDYGQDPSRTTDTIKL